MIVDNPDATAAANLPARSPSGVSASVLVVAGGNATDRSGVATSHGDLSELPMPPESGLQASDTPLAQAHSLYWVPAGHAAIYVNLSTVFPVGDGEDDPFAARVLAASHNRPDVIGNSLVLQVHKVMVLLFHIGDDAKAIGRAVTNIRVSGAVVESVIRDANGTVVRRCAILRLSLRFRLMLGLS